MATDRKPPRLGQVGPYMVCRECQEPLNLYSLVKSDDEWQEEKVIYLHPLETLSEDREVISLSGVERDHEPVPVEGNPLDAETPCDFCHYPNPKYVFVPRKQIRITDPLSGVIHDYSSPWACCDGCLSAVRNKRLGKMLDRVMNSRHGAAARLPCEERIHIRRMVREIYIQYIDSLPVGPYELRIKNEKPQGKPGSRKGM
ncbi:hypothetical protein ACFY0N_30690 [Streptomyces vinaceus]|uniref:hypothetical protein n=1 Tax=Streptomyces vinaceus TaxID=1960 RepID=UPI0036913EC5